MKLRQDLPAFCLNARGALALLSVAGLAFPRLAAAADSGSDPAALKRSFEAPSPGARPWTLWHWLGGNISREGITGDLEAMKEVGLGGALIYNDDRGTPPGPVTYMSREWRTLFKHAVEEAARLGLKLGTLDDSGWCGSGGDPDVTPELAEQHIVWTEAFVKGAGPLARKLLQPYTAYGYYRDIAVIAYPTPDGDGIAMADCSPILTADPADSASSPQGLAGGEGGTAFFFTTPRQGAGRRQQIQIDFPKPYLATGMKIAFTGIAPERRTTPFIQEPRVAAHLDASQDGRTYRTIAHLGGIPEEIVISFRPQRARHFRVVIENVTDVMERGSRDHMGQPVPDRIGISRLELLHYMSPIDVLGQKALGGSHVSSYQPDRPELPAARTVEPSRVIDLSSRVRKDGVLSWEVPPGRWTILRIGHTPRGETNRPSRNEGRGLECDKLNEEGIETVFHYMMDKVIADAGPLAGKSLAITWVDNSETGTPGWTRLFPREFRARRRYDPTPYLPVLTGRVVGSLEVSIRFLQDYRHTLSDLFMDKFVTRLADLSHEHGLKLNVEPYGVGVDQFEYCARIDEPTAEFWWNPNHTAHGNITPALEGHAAGKQVIASESFTSLKSEKWLSYPGNLKTEGDWAFSMGINKLNLHRYALQPWGDRRPGLSLGPNGIHFERTSTWWKQASPWIGYLTRCQALLQQGLFVADLCYLQAEEFPISFPYKETGELLPGRPGYNFDGASPRSVLDRFSVKDGRLLLPDGMSYRLLVLPTARVMSPELLGKIRDLVADGATVVGAKPLRSPSLTGYPACDRSVEQLANEIWGDCDGTTVREHRYGRGRVVWGIRPEEVLARDGVPPDFAYADSGADHTAERVADPAANLYPYLDSGNGFPLLYTHRTIGGADVYFLSNKRDRPIEGLGRFRVAGRQPEFWWPESGHIERAAAYRQAGKLIEVPIRLESGESVFVVFLRSGKASDPVVSITRNGATVPSAESERVAWVRAGRGEKLLLEASKPGLYVAGTASGRKLKARVAEIPAPFPVAGPWTVQFPPHWGAPDRIEMAKLLSWSDHSEAGVRYFSGTATYRTEFVLPGDFVVRGGRVALDLGGVQVVAEVRLNETDLGTWWKPPFRADVTQALRTGRNVLQVKVTNLWINRMIGDEQLPDDSGDRTTDGFFTGALKSWPQWLLEGRPSPTGRYTFSTWRIWQKNDPLVPSGLLGPVLLRCSAETDLK